ncbi:hypothetical protein SFUMM280S_05150 [Streptomyces fumanus]
MPERAGQPRDVPGLGIVLQEGQRGQQGTGAVGQRAESPAEAAFQGRSRQQGVRQCRPARPLVGGERRGQVHQGARVALRHGEDGGHGVGGQPRVTVRQHLPGGLLAERGQRQLRRAPVRRQDRPRPVGSGQQQHPGPVEPAGHERQGPGGGGVEPLPVVHGEQHGTPLGGGQRPPQRRADGRLVTAPGMPAQRLGQRRADRARQGTGHGGRRDRQRAERGVRRRSTFGARGDPQHLPTGVGGGPGRPAQQRAPAAAPLAPDGQCRAVPVTGARQGRAYRGEHVVPAARVFHRPRPALADGTRRTAGAYDWPHVSLLGNETIVRPVPHAWSHVCRARPAVDRRAHGTERVPT